MNPIEPGLVLDGRDLAFEANQHLFDWPGDLVCGSRTAISLSAPDVQFPEKRFTDWRRRRYTEVPMKQWEKKVEAPDESLRELRSRFGIHQEQERATWPSPSRPNMARGNEGAGMDARYNLTRWYDRRDPLPNPITDDIAVLQMILPRGETGTTGSGLDGAQWVCDSLALSILNSRPMMPPALVAELGAFQSGVVFAQYLEANDDRARTLVQNFEPLLEKVEAACEEKCQTLEREIGQWAEAGRRRVELPGGGLDQALCVANAITALVGIGGLARLGAEYSDFAATARLCWRGILTGLG